MHFLVQQQLLPLLHQFSQPDPCRTISSIWPPLAYYSIIGCSLAWLTAHPSILPLFPFLWLWRESLQQNKHSGSAIFSPPLLVAPAVVRLQMRLANQRNEVMRLGKRSFFLSLEMTTCLRKPQNRISRTLVYNSFAKRGAARLSFWAILDVYCDDMPPLAHLCENASSTLETWLSWLSEATPLIKLLR